MGVLAQYVSQSLPAAYPEGVPGAGTEGATWRWLLDVKDSSTGVAIDLTGIVGTCKILTPDLTTSVLDLTVTGGPGSLTIFADESSTSSKAAGATTARVCRWYMHLSDGTDDVEMWTAGAPKSTFRIYPAGA